MLLYMVTWIPSIYPLYVSIYTSTMDPMGLGRSTCHPAGLMGPQFCSRHVLLWGTNQQKAMETMSKNFATRWFISLVCDGLIILLQFNHMCRKISSIDHKDLSFSSSAPWSLQLASCACAAAPRDGRPKRVDVQRTRSGLRRTSPRKMWNN